MSLPPGEWPRRIVHVGSVAWALLFRWSSWWPPALLAVAAFVFNWRLLPRTCGRRIWRPAERQRGTAPGMLAYPLAVLGLVLLFHERLWLAAAGWGLLAVGDGMASLVGQSLDGPRLPWNPRKSWTGFLAFVVFGTLASAFLWAWVARLPLEPAASHWSRTAGTAFAVALACAILESLPTTLDDNITVPLAAALLLPPFSAVSPQLLVADPLLGRRVVVGGALLAVVALGAYLLRSIDGRGAFSAFAIGVCVTAGLGLAALALLVAFAGIAAALTRLGYGVKAARGIAQESGGRPGSRHAWANGSIPGLLAVLAGMAPPGLRDLLALAFAAAVASAAADTCSSEIGKAYGRRTVLITSLRPAAAGTEGAVSLEGTLGGLAGALAVGATGVLTGFFAWDAALVVAVAGLLGSLAESALGAAAARRGPVDDDLLNLANTAIGALAAVWIARLASVLAPSPLA